MFRPFGAFLLEMIVGWSFIPGPWPGLWKFAPLGLSFYIIVAGNFFTAALLAFPTSRVYTFVTIMLW